MIPAPVRILAVSLLLHYAHAQFPTLQQLLPECITRNQDTECPDKNILFHLYSGPCNASEQMDLTNRKWLEKSKYNMSLPTVVLIHGFTRANGMDVLRDAYVKRGTHNVIIVDWVGLAQVPCYLQAVNSLKGVAKCTAQMIVYLEAVGDIDLRNVTCIGHSLGAHVCGLISNFASEKLDKIVALDPARPLLQYLPEVDRLDEKDAKIVQVLHTSAGYYGLPGMVGTADFCLNNGLQPFCQKSITSILCSHFQAVCFFAESLDPEKVRKGSPCSRACPQISATQPGDSVRMGEFMEERASGMYCVKATEPPYCKNPDIDPDYGDERCCP